jgi:hypothetical protein
MIEEENEVITYRKNEIQEQIDIRNTDIDRFRERLQVRIRELMQKHNQKNNGNK